MPESNFAKVLTPRTIEEEMRQSYMEYAMSVIVGRALPDVRDGLKPVHRRVLFAMKEMGNDWNKAYKKSARVVGDVTETVLPDRDHLVTLLFEDRHQCGPHDFLLDARHVGAVLDQIRHVEQPRLIGDRSHYRGRQREVDRAEF